MPPLLRGLPGSRFPEGLGWANPDLTRYLISSAASARLTTGDIFGKDLLSRLAPGLLYVGVPHPEADAGDVVDVVIV